MSFSAHHGFCLQGVLDINYYFHFPDEESEGWNHVREGCVAKEEEGLDFMPSSFHSHY